MLTKKAFYLKAILMKKLRNFMSKMSNKAFKASGSDTLVLSIHSTAARLRRVGFFHYKENEML
jgi:hypothetical protein